MMICERYLDQTTHGEILPKVVLQPVTPQVVLQDRSTILTSSWVCGFDPCRLRYFPLSKELHLYIWALLPKNSESTFHSVKYSKATLCLQIHCLSSEFVSLLTKTYHILSAHRPFSYRPRGTVNIHHDKRLFRLGPPLVFVPRFRHEVNESSYN